MNGRNKLITWLTVLAFSLPAVGVVGCGFYPGDSVSAFFFYLFFGYSPYSHSGRDEAPTLDATIEMPGVVDGTKRLSVSATNSGARFQEADGFTAIGLQDRKAGVLVEMIFPGQATGDFRTAEDQSEFAPFFRVQTADQEYTSVGGDVTMVLDGPYPARGENFTGKAHGIVVGADGNEVPVTVSFTATRW